MSTGTIQNEAMKVFQDIAYGKITIEFLVAAGETKVVQGQEVVLQADKTIVKRTTGAQIPLGIVEIGAKEGEYAVITVPVQYTSEVEIDATVVPGDFARDTGTLNADERPIFTLAASGEYSMAMVGKAGVSGDVVFVLNLKYLHQVP